MPAARRRGGGAAARRARGRPARVRAAGRGARRGRPRGGGACARARVPPDEHRRGARAAARAARARRRPGRRRGRRDRRADRGGLPREGSARAVRPRARDAGDHRAPHRVAAAQLARSPDADRRSLLDRDGDALDAEVLALHATEDARVRRPTPLDEVENALEVFRRSLLEVTPRIYRTLEDRLALRLGGSWRLPSFLRWGTWVGGDRDGNPNVTARGDARGAAAPAPRRARPTTSHDVEQLGRALSISSLRARRGSLDELLASIEHDRERLPEVAAHAGRARRTSRGARSCGTCRRGCARRSTTASTATSTRRATARTSRCSIARCAPPGSRRSPSRTCATRSAASMSSASTSRRSICASTPVSRRGRRRAARARRPARLPRARRGGPARRAHATCSRSRSRRCATARR